MAASRGAEESQKTGDWTFHHRFLDPTKEFAGDGHLPSGVPSRHPPLEQDAHFLSSLRCSMAIPPMCKLMMLALVVSTVIFLEILAGALSNDWIILLILLPIAATPLPLMLLKCCSSDDGWGSSTPKGAHWAEFMTGFFFVGTIALPTMLYTTHLVELQSMLLAIGGVALAILAIGCIICAQIKGESDSFSAFQ